MKVNIIEGPVVSTHRDRRDPENRNSTDLRNIRFAEVKRLRKQARNNELSKK